ncbi:hypothetical protein NKF06_10725 [Haloferax sp. AB510]|uniref:hypothetical protein n=1 Tax=Haloferax sp. AB510 TaxID=2934172 RepID=UPI00209C3F58|nr:hypothetical protein [Haloferax sp. AB510]MCO8267050.1 hypothetical protein [Haloferax sp. AB510]
MFVGSLGESALYLRAVVAGLSEAAGVDDGGTHARRAALFDDLRHDRRGHTEQRESTSSSMSVTDATNGSPNAVPSADGLTG